MHMTSDKHIIQSIVNNSSICYPEIKIYSDCNDQAYEKYGRKYKWSM